MGSLSIPDFLSLCSAPGLGAGALPVHVSIFYVLDSKLKLEGDWLIMIILGLFGMCLCHIQPCDSLLGFLPSFWFLPSPHRD